MSVCFRSGSCNRSGEDDNSRGSSQVDEGANEINIDSKTLGKDVTATLEEDAVAVEDTESTGVNIENEQIADVGGPENDVM